MNQLPYELQKEINDLKLKFKSKGYIIKDIIVEKIDYDFWDLFYNRTPVSRISKMRNEDERLFNYDPPTNAIK